MFRHFSRGETKAMRQAHESILRAVPAPLSKGKERCYRSPIFPIYSTIQCRSTSLLGCHDASHTSDTSHLVHQKRKTSSTVPFRLHIASLPQVETLPRRRPVKLLRATTPSSYNYPEHFLPRPHSTPPFSPPFSSPAPSPPWWYPDTNRNL